MVDSLHYLEVTIRLLLITNFHLDWLFLGETRHEHGRYSISGKGSPADHAGHEVLAKSVYRWRDDHLHCIYEILNPRCPEDYDFLLTVTNRID